MVVAVICLSLVASKLLTPLDTVDKEGSHLDENETPPILDSGRSNKSGIIVNTDVIIQKINDRQVVEDEYFSYFEDNMELVDMLREYNELTTVYHKFFLRQATMTMIGVFMLEPYYNDNDLLESILSEVEDSLPDDLDIPADVLDMIERITHYSLYRNCTQLFLDDPILSPIIEKEAGGSAGQWPYWWNTLYLDNVPEVKEGLSDYFNLEKKLIMQLDDYKK